MRSLKLGTIISLAAVIGVLCMFRWRNPDPELVPVIRIDPSETDAGLPITVSNQSERAHPDTHVGLRGSAITLRNPQGEPVENADILLVRSRRISLCDALLQESHSSPTGAVIWRGISTPIGTCELPKELLEEKAELVIWIVKTNYFAVCVGMHEALAGEVITLEPDKIPQEARVTVVDLWKGAQIAVAQRLMSMSLHADSLTEATISSIELLHPCDGAHTARLVRCALRNTVQARTEDVISSFVSASDGRDVTLTLSGAFSASGLVTGEAFDGQRAGFVEYCIQRGSFFSVVARSKVESNGLFHLPRVPLVTAFSHSFLRSGASSS